MATTVPVVENSRVYYVSSCGHVTELNRSASAALKCDELLAYLFG